MQASPYLCPPSADPKSRGVQPQRTWRGPTAFGVVLALSVSACCRAQTEAKENEADRKAKAEAIERIEAEKRAAAAVALQKARAEADQAARVAKLTTAKVVAEVLGGSTKPKKKTTAKGFVQETFEVADVTEATRSVANPTIVRVTLPKLPDEGLGRGKPMCGKAETGIYTFIEEGPLQGRILLEAGPKVSVMSEGYLRSEDVKSCALRPSCESGRGLPHKPLSPPLLFAACQELVRGQLKAPSRAEFPPLDPANYVVIKNCDAGLAGVVDAPNTFNAMIRTKFACAWSPETDRISAKFLP